MENFIYTQDSEMAKKLQLNGYSLVNQNSNSWTFVNEGKVVFSESDKNKIIYTNKLSI